MIRDNPLTPKFSSSHVSYIYTRSDSGVVIPALNPRKSGQIASKGFMI